MNTLTTGITGNVLVAQYRQLFGIELIPETVGTYSYEGEYTEALKATMYCLACFGAGMQGMETVSKSASTMRPALTTCTPKTTQRINPKVKLLNTMQTKVDDPEVIGTLRLYLNPNMQLRWDDGNALFERMLGKSLEHHNMAFINYKYNKEEGYIEIQVKNLVGLVIYKAFRGIRGFATVGWAHQEKLESEEDKSTYHLWGTTSHWWLDLTYPDGVVQRVIQYPIR